MKIAPFLFTLAIASGIASNNCCARIQTHSTTRAPHVAIGGSLEGPGTRTGSSVTPGIRSVQHYAVPGAVPLTLHKSMIGGPVAMRVGTLGGPVAFRLGSVGGPMTTPMRHR